MGWSADKRGREWLQLRRGCETEDYAVKMLSSSSSSGGGGDGNASGSGHLLADTAHSDLVAAVLGSSMKSGGGGILLVNTNLIIAAWICCHSR